MKWRTTCKMFGRHTITVSRSAFRVVQSYGHRRNEWTVLSEHATIAEAFASIDAMSAQMVRTRAPSDAIALAIVDEHGDVVPRPATH